MDELKEQKEDSSVWKRTVLFNVLFALILLKVYILLWNKAKTPDEDPRYGFAME